MNSPNNQHQPAPARSTRTMPTYTAVEHRWETPSGTHLRTWKLVSERGHIVVQERSVARFWYLVAQWLGGMEQFGFRPEPPL